ncbi:cytochrome P450 [Xylariaceae sp. FL1272]|nr:cytochrome P450 [Xylariaceae sp. FL1272]
MSSPQIFVNAGATNGFMVDVKSLKPVVLLLLLASFYAPCRVIFLLYFHPLAGFPGPRLAAISNVWYAYHWLSGRYAWATEQVLRKYGDVVRIAPNELLFFTPEAFMDIYTPHVKNHETWAKTDINDRGDKHGGILWERDPVRHRQVAKQLAPTFSSKSTRAKEPRIHEHINFFVSQMTKYGKDGIDFSKWCNWLAMDISADMAYSRKMYQTRDMRSSSFLKVLLGFNKFSTIEQVSKRFPVLGKLKYLFLPLSNITSRKEMNHTNKKELERRIRDEGKKEHLDFFEQLVTTGGTGPENSNEFRHLQKVAGELLFAGFEPVSLWIFVTLLQLVKYPTCLGILTKEIRDGFTRYEDISSSKLAKLDYLNACLEESMRLLPSNNTGLPRVSPGGTVDGTYMPRGTTAQTSIFAASRSPRHFRYPLSFVPRRWLRPEHPLYDSIFAGDRGKELFPFSSGPRQCPGKEIAWTQARLFVGKVLWSFDLGTCSIPIPDIEKDFVHYGFWVKPEFQLSFQPRGGN